MNSPQNRQSGFAIVVATFLLVVLAALGAFMVSFSNTAQIGSAQDIQGSRAYWAARAGTDWAVAQAFANPAFCTTGFTPPSSFEGFNLAVNCVTADYTEGSGQPNLRVFTITTTANNASAVGSLGYVERQLTVNFEVGI